MNELSTAKEYGTVTSSAPQCLVPKSLFNFCYRYKRIFVIQIHQKHHIMSFYFWYIIYISSEWLYALYVTGQHLLIHKSEGCAYIYESKMRQAAL